MRRRDFLAISAVAGIEIASKLLFSERSTKEPTRPKFPGGDPKWERTWQSALRTLGQNVKHLSQYSSPVLIEGAGYPGIWQECAPLEGLVYAGVKEYVPDLEGHPTPVQIARANHMAFFALQREDGQLPAYIWMKEAGYGQIQMVVPIAATAWELAEQTADQQLLEAAYQACSRWDAWLRRFRNTRGTGLVEGFCTYDTGMDHSPRWAGMPDGCPDGDARRCPALASLPRLCPDLSATVYGGRVALSAMARALGKRNDADRWIEDAEHIRQLIIDKLYCSDDVAFYDLDAQGNFVRVRSVLIARVMGEHVLKLEVRRDRQIFDAVWSHQLHNAMAFWPPYPFPSVAVNDPTYVRSIPVNSWGGASQALTALRAPRWMAYYGKQNELRQLMRQWVYAIHNSGSTTGEFFQQLNPLTGEFTLSRQSGYSPAALVYLDFVKRLASSPDQTSGHSS